MIQQIDDAVQVAVVFKLNKAEPVKIKWNGRDYAVTQVNLVYSQFEGRAKVYYFSVSDSVNYFKLRFDTSDLTWRLVEIATN